MSILHHLIIFLIQLYATTSIKGIVMEYFRYKEELFGKEKRNSNILFPFAIHVTINAMLL
jgi:hypothetical protein